MEAANEGVFCQLWTNSLRLRHHVVKTHGEDAVRALAQRGVWLVRGKKTPAACARGTDARVEPPPRGREKAQAEGVLELFYNTSIKL